VSRAEPPLLDVDRAQISRTPDGAVVIDDAASPWVVHVWIADVDGRACISRIQIEARDDDPLCVTASRLGRLPTAQILQVAAAEVLGEGHDAEMFYRLLAAPRPRGERSWGPGHHARVLAVHEWAVRTGRPGGGARAVADLWGVALNPTAWRWLAAARRAQAARGPHHGDAVGPKAV
jgi:hypothetical protein